MNYIKVYSTQDNNEISVLKNVYTEEGIDFKLEDASAGTSTQKRILVAEQDQTKARELLDQTGFLTLDSSHTVKRQRTSKNRWMFFFLAALILLLVAMLIVWFMNV